MSYRIVECNTPNGAIYGVFYVDDHEIGRAYKGNDGLWTMFRNRKPQAADDAAKSMIFRMKREARMALDHAIRLENML